jgi:hypothetical protein
MHYTFNKCIIPCTTALRNAEHANLLGTASDFRRLVWFHFPCIAAGLSLSFVIKTMLDTYLVIKSAILDGDELIKVEKDTRKKNQGRKRNTHRPHTLKIFEWKTQEYLFLCNWGI